MRLLDRSNLLNRWGVFENGMEGLLYSLGHWRFAIYNAFSTYADQLPLSPFWALETNAAWNKYSRPIT